MGKKKKILVMITHSLGELDVLFPLFAGIKTKYEIDVIMIFAVKKIFHQYESNDFYLYCARELNIEVISCQLPNKFDYVDSRINNYVIGRLFLNYYFKILLITKLPFLLIKFIQSGTYMHEISNQHSSTRPLYWAKLIFKKKIIIYSHAHSATPDTRTIGEKSNYSEFLSLVFSENDKKFFSDLGYYNQYIIGYPKSYIEWSSMVMKYDKNQFVNQKTALIFTRHVHDYFMDLDVYEFLLSSCCKVIRKKMGNIPIVIKPHPREKVITINKILLKYGINNFFISHEDSSVLSLNAEIAISFWTSAILSSLMMGVPSIEYYIEAKRFREHEPEGSAYKKLGIDSTDNSEMLEHFIDEVLNGEYQIPPIIHELKKKKNIDFLNLLN